ncbi:MAG: phosphoglycerate kinase [Candidatus Doudnabacteria bacterium]|nr:phosphoglycerate kinase [Candidatus Doudnabacteria bacterium]
MAIKTIKTANIKNKTVLLRVDVNEPIENGKLLDDFRIQKIIPTIEFLRKQKCKIIIVGHLGRPEGRWTKELSLRPVAHRIAELLNYKFVETTTHLPHYPIAHVVLYGGKITEPETKVALDAASSKDIIILENIRYYKGEEENSLVFAKKLASLADIYVNEAFAVSHRKEASVVAITKYLPSYAGLLLNEELRWLGLVIKAPKHPFVLMMGGLKISEKAHTLENLGKHVDTILLGGGIANSLLAERGYEIGATPIETEAKAVAKRLLRNYKNKIQLPVDLVVANKKMDSGSIRVSDAHGVKKTELILDIGPKTILQYSRALKKAKTIVWNGPMGYFEHKPFHTGTMSLARIVGGVGKGRCFSVVGGGETVDALRLARQEHFVDHVSTGGGAMLELLAGKALLGVEALK